jgi:hypothetical protein
VASSAFCSSRDLPSNRAVIVCSGGFLPSRTIWVWVTEAMVLSPTETRVCQTMVWRPRCRGAQTAVTVSPVRAAARKFVLDSTVVVEAPGGRLSIVATPPRVSARAMMAPPCMMPGTVQSSSRTVTSALTLSGSTSSRRMPRRSGRRPLARSWMTAGSTGVSF